MHINSKSPKYKIRYMVNEWGGLEFTLDSKFITLHFCFLNPIITFNLVLFLVATWMNLSSAHLKNISDVFFKKFLISFYFFLK